MRARLLYRDAHGREASADLLAEGSFVGRSQECAVRTDDAMVSRRNCRLWSEGATWFVEDLGSSNGTFVNDRRIQKRHELAHADIVRCGSLQVRFVEVADEKSDRIDVDPALLDEGSELEVLKSELGAVLADRSAKEQKLFDLGRERDALKLRAETEVGELAHLRSELAMQREKFSVLSRERQQSDEELNAQVRVAEQLRRELDALKREQFALREQHDKLAGDLQARDRQLERAGDDVQRAKAALDALRAHSSELEKNKDAGWRELNLRVGELDGLRAVISEQERLLEERRVGLIALESTGHELRQHKERVLRELVAARAERDEAKLQLGQIRKQLEVLQEEHRLEQKVQLAQSTGEEALQRVSAELRQARVECNSFEQARKKAEADGLLHEEAAARLRAELEKTRAELRVANDALKSAPIIERHVRAFEHEQTTRPVHLDAPERPAPNDEFHEEVTWDGETVRRSSRPDDGRISQLESELAALGAELAAARALVSPTPEEPERVREIQALAQDAYDGVNDALSELRTNILLARRLTNELGVDSDGKRALAAALSAAVDRSEDAKGILRMLRDVARQGS